MAKKKAAEQPVAEQPVAEQPGSGELFAGEFSKQAAVVAYLESLPPEQANAISGAALLAALTGKHQGVRWQTGDLTNGKVAWRKRHGIVSSRGRRTLTEGTPVPRMTQQPSSLRDALAKLREAKKLIEEKDTVAEFRKMVADVDAVASKVGGLDNLREILAMLEEWER